MMNIANSLFSDDYQHTSGKIEYAVVSINQRLKMGDLSLLSERLT